MSTGTYFGKPEVKQAAIDRALDHRNADHIIQGHFAEWGDHFRGCAVGCLATPVEDVETIKAALDAWFVEKYRARNPNAKYDTVSVHNAYGRPEDAYGELDKVFGIPPHLGGLADAIFEALDADGTEQDWPARFAAAVPVGAVIEKSEVEEFVCRNEAVAAVVAKRYDCMNPPDGIPFLHDGYGDFEVGGIANAAADALVEWLATFPESIAKEAESAPATEPVRTA